MVGEETFRKVMGHFATGVTVVADHTPTDCPNPGVPPQRAGHPRRQRARGRSVREGQLLVAGGVLWVAGLLAILLIGRWLMGWRGRTAIRWTLGGFISLMLAYFGSKMVLELILAR